MPTTPHTIRKLEKILEYALGRHPDEFGLIPDSQGFVKIKTLLQALHEDPEWRHIREGHLRSAMLMQHPAACEITNDLIRARSREHLPVPIAPPELPKILYTTVRRRAYSVVLDKGIRPGGTPSILLSPDPEMAKRLGRRMDNDPVLIIVRTAASRETGTVFQKFGELLYLADFIPTQTFSAPAPPRESSVTAPSQIKAVPEKSKTPGSFFPDPASIENPGAPIGQRRKRDSKWKQDRRRARKEKDRLWK